MRDQQVTGRELVELKKPKTHDLPKKGLETGRTRTYANATSSEVVEQFGGDTRRDENLLETPTVVKRKQPPRQLLLSWLSATSQPTKLLKPEGFEFCVVSYISTKQN